MRTLLGSAAGAATIMLAMSSVATAAEPAPALYGIRPLGMGNAFVAAADDRNALYYNPARLGSVTSWSISGVGVQGRLDETFPDVLQFIEDNEEEFENFDTVDASFYDELAPYDNRWVSAEAQSYMDMVKPGLGLGVYTSGSANLKIDRGVYEPRVYERVLNDIVAVAGASMDLGRLDLTGGAAVKGIWRRTSDRVYTAREVADFDADVIIDELQKADEGFAMDWGLNYQRPDARWNVSAVWHDAFGFVAGEPIQSGFDVGAAWRPSIPSGGILRGVLLAADLKNMFQGEAFGTMAHFGAEVRIPLLSLRGGFNQGYASAGASLNIPFLSAHYAYFGKELGVVPGAEQQNLHAVEVRLGF